MAAKWNDDECKKLVEYSKQVLGTEIPVATEIYDSVNFLESLRIIRRQKRDRVHLKATISYKLKWLPRYWDRHKEIPIPESVLDAMYEPLQRMLDLKCDHLANICEYPNAKQEVQ